MSQEALSLHEIARTAGSIEAITSLETAVSRMQAIMKIGHTQFSLVTIVLRFEQEGKLHGNRLALLDQSAHYYLENLRTLVRKTDSVFLLQHTFYFLLPGANQQGGAIVQERLWEALLWRVHNTLEGDFLRPRSMAIGYSTCIVQHDDIHQCIAQAHEEQLSFELQSEKIARKARSAKDGELPALARKLGVPYVSLLPRKLPARLQRLLSPTLAQELHCFPIGRDRDILTVAMSNPQDRCALERLRRETGLNIFPVLAHPQELQTAIEQLV